MTRRAMAAFFLVMTLAFPSLVSAASPVPAPPPLSASFFTDSWAVIEKLWSSLLLAQERSVAVSDPSPKKGPGTAIEGGCIIDPDGGCTSS